MRRALALVAVMTAVLAATACTDSPAQPSAAGSASPGVTGTAAVPATPPVTPGEPVATRQVCADAAAAAADVTKVFNDQIALLEQAASKGDQTAMVAAATAIQQKFLTLATSLTTLSEKPVDSDVKAALTAAAAALKDISSENYAGTTQDTQKRLGELAVTFTKACS